MIKTASQPSCGTAELIDCIKLRINWGKEKEWDRKEEKNQIQLNQFEEKKVKTNWTDNNNNNNNNTTNNN